MPKRAWVPILFLACATLAPALDPTAAAALGAPASLAEAEPGREAGHYEGAQEGHPLTGTWAGDWDSGAAQRTHVTMVMNWDGKAVTGIINPGPDAIPLTSVTVDWGNWTVRIEAKGIAAEGRLEDIGSYHRRIVGTWTQGGITGGLRLTRE